MKIEFDTTWVKRSAQTPPSAPPVVAQAGAQTRPTAEIQRQPDQDPLVRPEKVEAAKAFLEDPEYPPNSLLDRIANLLTGKVR
jgi:hypothetical protein